MTQQIKGHTMNKASAPMTEDNLSDPRREFLKNVLTGSAAATVLMVSGPGVAAMRKHQLPQNIPEKYKAKHHWIYVVNIKQCIGCGNCVRACRRENSVPDEMFRTWVERYLLTNEGVYVESPKGALEGFEKYNEELKAKAIRSYTVPKLCNHCHKAPCIQVCPVGATFKAPEGHVMVDWEHCIGCAYCVQGCPYAARFINPVEHKADKCTWCYHRTMRGMRPACVTVCPNRARLWGDLNDAEDEVTQIFEEGQWMVLKPQMHTDPSVFYVGLPKEVI